MEVCSRLSTQYPILCSSLLWRKEILDTGQAQKMEQPGPCIISKEDGGVETRKLEA